MIHIINAVLECIIMFFAGWAFGSTIAIGKKLKSISKDQQTLAKLLQEENNILKEQNKLCIETNEDNKDLIKAAKELMNNISSSVLFIKQNMVRRKIPITKE
jgi:hypothetical protein